MGTGPMAGVNPYGGGYVVRWDVDGWQAEALIREKHGGSFAVEAIAFYPPQSTSWVFEDGLDLGKQEPLPEDAPTISQVLRHHQLAEVVAGVRKARDKMRAEGRASLFPPAPVAARKALTDEQLADLAERYLDAMTIDRRAVRKVMLARYRSEGVEGLTDSILRDRIRIAAGKDPQWITDPIRKGTTEGREAGPALIEWRKEHPRPGRRKRARPDTQATPTTTRSGDGLEDSILAQLALGDAIRLVRPNSSTKERKGKR